MNINLSDNDIFNDNQFTINKNITIIYGKNGTGKSTLADQIKQLDNDYNVLVFQGFDSIIGDNEKLNGIILGVENAEINEQIIELNNKIDSINNEIKIIQSDLERPINNELNLWTRKIDAETNLNKASEEVEKVYSNIASEIKNMDNPRIASINYNKAALKKELSDAKPLSEEDLNKFIKILKSESKNANFIEFPKIELSGIVNEVNSILKNSVEAVIEIPRLNTTERKKFAEFGLKIHNKGDICAFCGNVISDANYNDLNSFFSSDDITRFRQTIFSLKNSIQDTLETIKSISINQNDFYSNYDSTIKAINLDVEKIKKENIEVLEALLNELEEKLKYLFEERNTLSFDIPSDFSEIEKKYNCLVSKNNSDNINNLKEEAEKQLRLHYIHEFSDLKDLDSIQSILQTCKTKFEEISNLFNEKCQKINGVNGLKNQKNMLEQQIVQLQSKTISEKILAEKINCKLRGMVSFQLEHVDGSGFNKGFYHIKDSVTEQCRDIKCLSTGEKNIIAFLYFIEKLNEINDELRNKKKIIVFDDPMNSNDDGMQYLIIEELRNLMKTVKNNNDYLVLMTHNKHFYINVKHTSDYKNFDFFRFESDGYKTFFKKITKDDEDFKTSYESLWQELEFLYTANVSEDLLLNPIRRIIETFTKFNNIHKSDFFDKVSGSKKLFDVNSHSIDDLEADLSGKTKFEIMNMLYSLFKLNNFEDHFKSHCSFNNSRESI